VADASEMQSESQVSVDLVDRIGSGDRSAEAELQARYGAGLLYLLKRRTADREVALDLRQDTFRIAIQKLRAREIEQPERIAGFLRGIALNLALAHERKGIRQATTADTDVVEHAPDDGHGPFENVSMEQTQALVRQLLDELPVERDRDILIATYLNDEDKESICARLGLDSTHFNRVLYRAKERFRKLLMDAERRNRFRLVS